MLSRMLGAEGGEREELQGDRKELMGTQGWEANGIPWGMGKREEIWGLETREAPAPSLVSKSMLSHDCVVFFFSNYISI